MQTINHHEDCVATDFTRVKLIGIHELLIHNNGKTALVITPWWEGFHQEIAVQAKTLGFTDTVAFGTLLGYTIPESDNNDWEYMVLSRPRTQVSAA
jgi:hypothetical protein